MKRLTMCGGVAAPQIGLPIASGAHNVLAAVLAAGATFDVLSGPPRVLLRVQQSVLRRRVVARATRRLRDHRNSFHGSRGIPPLNCRHSSVITEDAQRRSIEKEVARGHGWKTDPAGRENSEEVAMGEKRDFP